MAPLIMVAKGTFMMYEKLNKFQQTFQVNGSRPKVWRTRQGSIPLGGSSGRFSCHCILHSFWLSTTDPEILRRGTYRRHEECSPTVLFFSTATSTGPFSDILSSAMKTIDGVARVAR